MKYKILIASVLSSLFVSPADLSAREILSKDGRAKETKNEQLENNQSGKNTSTCAVANAFTNLDINNVRALIYNDGMMWFDRGSVAGVARYEVPKGSGKHSLFAGSVWIGGYDAGNNLKVAAQTYRQFGQNDYWPGPLNGQGATEADICSKWDKIWKINQTEILDFIADFDNGNNPDFNPNDARWTNIRQWPGYGNANLTEYSNDWAGKSAVDFAPFVDFDGDGEYDPGNGDYPEIKGDQYLWWMFNDASGVKNETNTPAIGMEVHGAAFAFLTNDQLNDATFYNYKLINRSTTELDSCYIATFTDADLGYAFDDYVGCDTTRSLGILYNGDAFDGNGLPAEYGDSPPIVGIDFFEGPVNEDTVELGMSSFVFFNNDNTDNLGNPQSGIHFYRYMTGSLRNGGEYTQTCNGVDASVNKTKFVYWGDPGKPGDLNTNWTECGCNNPADDRRFVHSSGPFKLKPGAEPINVTIGAIWADDVNYPCPSFGAIQIADDKAQELFDRNFIPVEPPNAPILTIRELDEKLILYINNPEGSNNYNQGYGTDFKEISAKGVALGYSDSACTYRFEGYKIFQVADSSISTGDLYNDDGTVNSDNARLVYQCDLKNGISRISNFEESPNSLSATPYFEEQLKVDGADAGINQSVLVTKDLFSTSVNSDLVNYKRYYYIAVAYAYNEFAPFDASDPTSGQNVAYLESFKNGYGRAIDPVTCIPNPANTGMGNQLRADYGDGVAIKVLEGKGNGGNYLIMSEESENQALFNENHQASELVYEKGFGPVNVKVIDPVKVPAADFELWLQGPSSSPGDIDTSRGLVADQSSWFVKNLTTGDTIMSRAKLNSVSEQILGDYGLSITVNQVPRPGDDQDRMGLVGDTIIYDIPTLQWLGGVQDGDGRVSNNWIRSGNDASEPTPVNAPDDDFACEFRDFERSVGSFTDGLFIDNNSVYENLINSTWSPYSLVASDPRARCGFGLAYDYKSNTNATPSDGYFRNNRISRREVLLQRIRSVDIVLTPDREKWSKCAVVELHDIDSFKSGYVGNEDYMYSEGKARKFDLRRHASVLRDPGTNGEVLYNEAEYGTSYFPGYAINVETGERLNIFFGEDSYLQSENGRDMIWNPTDGGGNNGLGPFNQDQFIQDALFGGKHAIYVSNTKYDECEDIVRRLKDAEALINLSSNTKERLGKLNVYAEVMWTGLPLINPGYKLKSWADGMIPTPTRIRLRTALPYQEHDGGYASIENNTQPRYFFSTKDQTMVNWSGASGDEADALLKRIRVVPNPYLGYSAYEWNRFDNRVKIINLPRKATINIYSLDGVLIRTLTKDNETSFIEWDLKNSVNIAISGGAYIMHVQADGIGETVLKWFAAIRPTDITTF